MKQAICRTLFMLAMLLGYGVSYAQSNVASCPKKGTADCPLVQNCPKKGAKDCPYTTNLAKKNGTNAELAACPLKGTAACPLVNNCPLKGTPDCPLVKNESDAAYAAKKTAGKKRSDAELPPCCRKSS